MKRIKLAMLIKKITDTNGLVNTTVLNTKEKWNWQQNSWSS